MKNNKKKGFTIVELVIVIAVIAILSAVLIPTFSGVTKKAKEAAKAQELQAVVNTITIGLEGDLDGYTYYFSHTYDHDGKADTDDQVDWYRIESGKAVVLTGANVPVVADLTPVPNIDDLDSAYAVYSKANA